MNRFDLRSARPSEPDAALRLASRRGVGGAGRAARHRPWPPGPHRRRRRPRSSCSLNERPRSPPTRRSCCTEGPGRAAKRITAGRHLRVPGPNPRRGPSSWSRARPTLFPLSVIEYFVDRLRTTMWCPRPSEPRADRAGKIGPENAQIGDEYSYTRRPLTLGRLRLILQSLGGGGGPVGQDEGAIFLASMAAEPSRYSGRAHHESARGRSARSAACRKCLRATVDDYRRHPIRDRPGESKPRPTRTSERAHRRRSRTGISDSSAAGPTSWPCSRARSIPARTDDELIARFEFSIRPFVLRAGE